MPLSLAEVLTFKVTPSIYDRFAHSFPSIPREEAELIYQDCLRFLWLLAKKDEERKSDPTVPDVVITKGMRIIDEMWHSFILYTEYYVAFCDKYLGEFKHHPPVLHKFYQNQEARSEEERWELALGEFIECVYEELGEEVAVRWFATYVEKYDFPHMMH
ncbi:MAG: hypothetical protein AB8G22_12550 [Saprospiraceae bacterium]